MFTTSATSNTTATSITAVIQTAVAGDTTTTTTINTTDITTTVELLTSSPTLSSSSLTLSSSSLTLSSSSSSVGVTVAIVVVLVVVLIIITVVVIGIIVVWKERKSKQHIKPEDVYYSTIDETTLQRTSKNKPQATHNEVDDKEEPHYIFMEVVKSAKCTKADKVAMQDNPSYSIISVPSDQVKMQAYGSLSSTKH